MEEGMLAKGWGLKCDNHDSFKLPTSTISLVMG